MVKLFEGEEVIMRERARKEREEAEEYGDM